MGERIKIVSYDSDGSLDFADKNIGSNSYTVSKINDEYQMNVTCKNSDQMLENLEEITEILSSGKRRKSYKTDSNKKSKTDK